MSPSGAVGGAGVLVRLGPGRLSLAQELHCREQAVEVGVRHDRVDRAGALDDVASHQLGAGVRVAVRHQAESRIAAHARPADRVLVVIDPDGEAIAESLEEREGHLLEILAAGEGDVEHRDAALGRSGKAAGLLDEHHAHGLGRTHTRLAPSSIAL